MQKYVRCCDHGLKKEQGDEEEKLRKRNEGLEEIIRIQKLEMKAMIRNHRAEIRWREKKELLFVLALGGFVVIYCVCALLVRGYV